MPSRRFAKSPTTVIPVLAALLALLALPAALGAADDPSPPAGADAPAATPAAAPADEAALRKDAETCAAAGRAAMRDSDADPHRGVDAAIAFSHALQDYEKLSDSDAVCEMQADIFWCKKRMNLENLQEYVAHKGKDAAADFSNAQAVMARTVPASEAASYLDRADKYRLAHADNHFQNAIFYSEIVDRFPDSDQAKQAGKLFDHEQSAYLVQVSQDRAKEQQQLTSALEQVRKNRFQEPPVVAVGSQSALPDKDAIATAEATVNKAYHDDMVHAKKEGQKRTLARRLATEAEQSKDDAAAYYVMINESQRLASEAEDYETILADIEHLGAAFSGYDAGAAKKAAMKKLASRPTASAILKLLDDPTDKSANLVVGKFYCYNLGRWPDGLQMLSLGSDAAIHDVAEMELGEPKSAEEIKHTGDSWYQVGKKSSGQADKIGAWTRAEHWYLRAMPQLSGVNKTMTQTRLDEMDNVLPATVSDWDNITPKQWEHLKGSMLVIEARKDRSDTEIELADGQTVRIVACPTDTWKWNNGGDDFDCYANGNWPNTRPRHYYSSTGSGDGSGTSGGGSSQGQGMSSGMEMGWQSGKFQQGQLTCKVNNTGEELALGLVHGPGHLFMQPHNTWGMVGSGQIRVKIMPVADDD
jgi:hypothetical protein